MRYMLTGEHWTADESYRIGITQQIAPTPAAALEAGVRLANQIAACAPLSIKATLASAHQVVDPIEADALSRLGPQYGALYRTEDFLEGRRAEAEGVSKVSGQIAADLHSSSRASRPIPRSDRCARAPIAARLRRWAGPSARIR